MGAPTTPSKNLLARVVDMQSKVHENSDQDPIVSCFYARRASEAILRGAWEYKTGKSLGSSILFDKLIHQCSEMGIIPGAINISSRTIQAWGNFAVHPRGDEEEIVTKNLILPCIVAFDNLVKWFKSEFFSKDKLSENVEIITEKEIFSRKEGLRYVCPTCNERFAKATDLRKHRSKTGHSSFRCGTCDQPFASPASIAEHQRITNHAGILGIGSDSEEVPVGKNSALQEDGTIEWFSGKKGCKYPKDPSQCALILNLFESNRNTEHTWSSIGNQIRSLIGYKDKGILRSIINCFDKQNSGEKLWERGVSWEKIPQPLELLSPLMGYCLVYSTERGLGVADKEYHIRSYFSTVDAILKQSSYDVSYIVS